MHGVRVKTRWGGRAGKRVSSVDTSGGRRYSCPTSGRARVALPTGARSSRPVSVKVLFSANQSLRWSSRLGSSEVDCVDPFSVDGKVTGD